MDKELHASYETQSQTSVPHLYNPFLYPIIFSCKPNYLNQTSSQSLHLIPSEFQTESWSIPEIRQQEAVRTLLHRMDIYGRIQMILGTYQ
jgi:hypothetical protein